MEDIYYIGQKSDTTKTISEHDVYSFAGITGDFNYAHINEEYAKNTKFETRIAHGMISAGLISSVLGMKLPGNGTIYLSQSINFKKAVKIGDTIKAEVEIIEIIDKKKFTILKLKTVCYNQFGEIVTEGIAQVIPPSDKQ